MVPRGVELRDTQLRFMKVLLPSLVQGISSLGWPKLVNPIFSYLLNMIIASILQTYGSVRFDAQFASSQYDYGSP